MHPNPLFPMSRINYGCLACRNTGNCSTAVDNRQDGVYCGNLFGSFEPCCCKFMNQCSINMFDDKCYCDADIGGELYPARFIILVVITGVCWVALMVDRMCGRPYKIMNSHQPLPGSP
ncbi:TPA: hypothetical protein N0F65_005175 [Lagenidium giganteum]|uniref:Uncharacterized protein n=1 Tax=Lagenidium giganteum TaxID=4803 RepID=A0AAV2Z0S3_9STRA|nr:TPA: hypothetical protein N0F65_005175 [Lagenidium giganteum]